ncbi:MAG: spore maturation protein A [Candidatus Paraimprobicoccus trichonymphae]|uniref:Spore maturation protein A n=1 Tax=Candidatus Paraimprobicoccus trichonymphae TaxID=3033793 RepID=A0AA48IHI4_9FIRM|nr:MAG: spore maturation protein A [Candidatus Paraimprobicoccus trichonymphae]
MNYVWAFIMVISIICALITGRINLISSSLISGAENSIAFVVSLIGIMSFWTGLMKIAEASGLTNILAKVFMPILKFIFPEYTDNSSVLRAISMNLTANFFGLGNAATPFGLKAIKEMHELNNKSDIASNGMITFMILNTAPLQLISTTLIAMQQKYGADNPFDILIFIWIISIASVTIGLIFSKIFQKLEKKYD